MSDQHRDRDAVVVQADEFLLVRSSSWLRYQAERRGDARVPGEHLSPPPPPPPPPAGIVTRKQIRIERIGR